MNKKLVGLFVLLCVLIGASRKYNLFSMDKSDKQKVKEYYERLKAAQEDPKVQEELRERLEKAPDWVRRSIKQPGKCPLSEEFINFLLSGGPITLRGHTDQVSSVAFSPDGSKLATGSADRTAKLWDVHTGKLLHTVEHEGTVLSVSFSPDGSKLATGSFDNTATLWDVNTGQLLHTLAGHINAIELVAFSPDGSKIVTGSHDKTAKLWDVKTGKLLHTFAGHSAEVYSVAFSPDGSKLATGSDDNTAKLWDVKTGDLLFTFDTQGGAWSIAFSPDGSKVTTVLFGNIVKLWDVNTGKQLPRIEEDKKDWIYFLPAISPDGSKRAKHEGIGTVRLYDIQRLNEIARLREKEKKEKAKKFEPDLKKTVSLQRFLNVLSDEECKDDPDYCNVMSIEQCELLQAFENTFQMEEPGWFDRLIGRKKRPVGRIQATPAQWQTFKTLPDVLQDILRNRIKAPGE